MTDKLAVILMDAPGFKCPRPVSPGMPVEVSCDNCGETTEKYPSEIDDDGNNFCSHDCYLEYREANSEEYVLTEERNQKISEALSGREFSEEHREAIAESRNREGAWKGENNPNWSGGPPELTCEWCGDTFKPRRAGQESRFCSQGCLWRWQSKEYAERGHHPPVYEGEDHPLYTGGTNLEYGENWQEQRAKALERDSFACQGCGVTADDYPIDLDVHHIEPRSEFDDDEAMNAVENLVTLCRSCHMKVERGEEVGHGR